MLRSIVSCDSVIVQCRHNGAIGGVAVGRARDPSRFRLVERSIRVCMASNPPLDVRCLATSVAISCWYQPLARSPSPLSAAMFGRGRGEIVAPPSAPLTRIYTRPAASMNGSEERYMTTR
jgi:hypothetical protein